MFQVNAYDKTLLLIFSYSVSLSFSLLLFLSFFCNIQNSAHLMLLWNWESEEAQAWYVEKK